MKILRGISPVEVGKLLILDILKDRGGRGVGLLKEKPTAQNWTGSRVWNAAHSG
jgi:hypothetical protein